MMGKTVVMNCEFLDPDQVVADYYCDLCEERQNRIPVQESIYTGAPMCAGCDKEMALDRIYLLKED
jgi:hypothetical protein